MKVPLRWKIVGVSLMTMAFLVVFLHMPRNVISTMDLDGPTSLRMKLAKHDAIDYTSVLDVEKDEDRYVTRETEEEEDITQDENVMGDEMMSLTDDAVGGNGVSEEENSQAGTNERQSILDVQYENNPNTAYMMYPENETDEYQEYTDSGTMVDAGLMNGAAPAFENRTKPGDGPIINWLQKSVEELELENSTFEVGEYYLIILSYTCMRFNSHRVLTTIAYFMFSRFVLSSYGHMEYKAYLLLLIFLVVLQCTGNNSTYQLCTFHNIILYKGNLYYVASGMFFFFFC